MKLFKDMPKSDRRILSACVLFMLLFGFLLWDERWMQIIDRNSQALKIGEISMLSSDVRHKSANQLDWRKASSFERVSLGDSIFTGQRSQATVQLQDGSLIQVGERSLVSFKKIKGVEVSNLNFGDFKIKVNGKLQVAFNGELVNLEGRNSEVQAIISKDNKLTLKSIKGKTQVSSPKIGKKDLDYASQQIEPVVPPTFVVRSFPPMPRPLAAPLYIWKVDDLYAAQLDGSYQVRLQLPRNLPANLDLAWRDSEEKATYVVELANNEEFSENLRRFQQTEKTLHLDSLPLGETFWRVSRLNQSEKSAAQRLLMNPQFLEQKPTFAQSHAQLTIIDKPITHTLRWQFTPGAAGYLLEVSSDPNFHPTATHVTRTAATQQDLRFSSPVTYYTRLRAYNQRQELSEASEPLILTAMSPPLLAAPQLPTQDLLFNQANVPSELIWNGPNGATKYEVEVVDGRTQQKIVKQTEQQKIGLKTLPNGPYYYNVTAIDRYGRRGKTSKAKAFSIEYPALIQAKREPSQENTSTVKLETPKTYFNQHYPDSRIQVEGSGFSMYSSDQVSASQKSPLAATMGLRWLQWKEKLGLEGLFKTKVFNYNSEASNVAPMSAEARVHRRWKVPLNWLYLFRELQISLFLGAEMYRNSGSSLYSQSYNLFKVGSLISFPLADRWETGGELVYGRATDASYKYEISGYLNYFIKKKWTYGLGYRVHLFEAGSLESAPSSLPFREGYVELYSALRYLY